MTGAYWILQFMAVGLCYAFVMFLWPLVVFRGAMRNKSRTARFAFCTCGMVLFINLAVLAAGLIPHALHGWIVCLLFYGIFAASVWRQLTKDRKRRAGAAVLHLIGGTMGWKSFFLRVTGGLKEALKYAAGKIKAFFHGHLVEYGIVLFLCAYAVLYFGWGAFDLRIYGFGDMYVHHSWIDGLLSGEIFSKGIYPEGMHTFIYLMHCVSGIRVYSILLFLAPIHSAVLVVSMWAFLKEIFHWKYSAALTVLLFLILEQDSINDIYSMSRIQWTIPQEFALFSEFLCGLFLIRLLKGKREKENRLLFGMAVAASFATHFYVTIMAVIVCAGIVLSRLPSFLGKGRWRKILITAVMAVVIPVIPMAGAFAEGRPLQGSLTWALEVMQGQNSDSDSNSNGSRSEESGTGVSASQTTEETSAPVSQTTEHISAPAQESSAPASRTRHSGSGAPGRILTSLENNFETLYGSRKGKLFAAFTALIFVISLLYKLVSIRSGSGFMDGALAASLTAVLFMLDYAASDLGLPQLIAGARILTSERLFVLAVLLVIPDLVFTGFFRKARALPQETVGIFSMIGTFLLVILTGQYHGYLYYEESRYTEAAETTNRIIREMTPLSYTIVSPTDELYQVKGHGYHEELLTLVKSSENTEDYSLPSEYIFVFIEKKPLLYGQTHFFRGPRWLAVNGKNTGPYRHYHLKYSEDPDAVAGKISEEEADKTLTYEIGEQIPSEDHEARIIMESKAMRWVGQFRKYYPHDIHTYFEDDSFVCYMIRQDPQIPYRIGFFAENEEK